MKAKEFGEYIRKIRKNKKMTIRQLELYSGVSNSYLSQLENGKRGIPSADIIKKLAPPLGVSQTELMIKAGYIDEVPNKPYTAPLTEKDEQDIAKRLNEIKNDIEHADGLAFDGEPFSKEAQESFLEAMEYIVRTTKKINKKYTPKKYRKENSDE
ncbi:immunity repressor protein [Bacillus sp. VT-16-64]|nr:immunity repressor protein [Bacillus sp. VT-16-64]